MIHEVFAYLRVESCAAAIRFYEEAFGAKEKFRLVEPGGRIGHAELLFGDATVMLSEAFPEYGIFAPEGGKTSVGVHLHVDDADAVVARAVAAGAVIVRPIADHFYGERSGALRDPFGHEWAMATHVEDVTPEEMVKRMAAMEPPKPPNP